MFLIAALLSAGFHAVVFLGVGRRYKVVRAVEEKTNLVQIVLIFSIGAAGRSSVFQRAGL